MMSNSSNTVKQAFFKLVGARGSPLSFLNRNTSAEPKGSNFGVDVSVSQIAENRLVFLGEIHSTPAIVRFQTALQKEMAHRSRRLHVVMEHFSLDMQEILRQYQEGSIELAELERKYHEVGSEGHDLEPYYPLLENAKENQDKIVFHAGFIPRSYARLLMKEGEDGVRSAVAGKNWLPNNWNLDGTEQHYNIFESLISGRKYYESDEATDNFRKIFKAQILKDVSMAHAVNRLAASGGNHEHEGNDEDSKEKILVIAGNGHLMGFCGVPERVLAENPVLEDASCLILSMSTNADLADHDAVLQDVISSYGPPGTNPADYIYVYRDEAELSKAESQLAYDKVGASAHLEGNRAKAEAIMHKLGYSPEQIQVAGDDVYNFQGVGNPHPHAAIQSGDVVVDIGSGLGVDSFIAADATGPTGRVVGIDISAKQVEFAKSRVSARGSDNLVFEQGDMERLPLPDNSCDVVISNGAFCLAPNKEKSFKEIMRVLKPGGRFSVCTTTLLVDSLEEGVNWPSCMNLFAPLKEIRHVCDQAGFEDVEIDGGDSSMTMELPIEVMEGDNPDRNKVHVGRPEFEHLEEFDMDKLCARVVVYGRKPREL